MKSQDLLDGGNAGRKKVRILQLQTIRSGFERFFRDKPIAQTDSKLNGFFNGLTGIWKYLF